MDAGDATFEDKKLSELFTDAWKAYQDIETSEESTNSETIQKAVEKHTKILDLVAKSVFRLDLFSSNEEFDEIASADIKFFLLPALQAAFIAKRATGMDGRLDVVTSAMEFYRTFLQQCYDYGTGPLSAIKEILVSSSAAPTNGHTMPGTGGGNAARDIKIKKYKAAKQRDEQITLLKHHLEDEDTCRKYWKLQLDKWIDVAIDDLEMFQQEVIMLERMKNMGGRPVVPPAARPPPLKPFLLTRNKLQAAVYGAGYPSIPTVTLDEWFEAEAAAGRMGQQGPPSSHDADDKSEDEDNDIDNPDKIRKAREWDDFKDTTRRGDGNRKNKG